MRCVVHTLCRQVCNAQIGKCELMFIKEKEVPKTDCVLSRSCIVLLLGVSTPLRGYYLQQVNNKNFNFLYIVCLKIIKIKGICKRGKRNQNKGHLLT